MPEPSHPRGVLITRAEPGAHDTVIRVAAMGFTPIAAPMLAIRPLPARLPARIQAVLLTSANALPALPASLHALPLLAVGDATTARARAAGFAAVTSADGDATALAALVARSLAPSNGALLLPTARGEGTVLAGLLRAAGFAVQRRTVYAAVPQKSFPRPAAEALARGTVAAALFFSAAAARQFATLLPAALPLSCLRAVDALALSAAVATPLAALPWRSLRVAARPTQDELLTLLADPNDE